MSPLVTLLCGEWFWICPRGTLIPPSQGYQNFHITVSPKGAQMLQSAQPNVQKDLKAEFHFLVGNQGWGQNQTDLKGHQMEPREVWSFASCFSKILPPNGRELIRTGHTHQSAHKAFLCPPQDPVLQRLLRRENQGRRHSCDPWVNLGDKSARWVLSPCYFKFCELSPSHKLSQLSMLNSLPWLKCLCKTLQLHEVWKEESTFHHRLHQTEVLCHTRLWGEKEKVG